MEVVVLCGGTDSRMRSILGDTPKILAPVGDRTLLDIHMEHLIDKGIEKVVFCIGFGSNILWDYLQSNYKEEDRIEILFSPEEPPYRGTAGAIKKVEDCITGETFIVMNGDTVSNIDFGSMIENMTVHSSFIVNIAVARMQATGGTIITLGNHGCIEDVEYRRSINKELVSIGVYGMSSSIFEYIPSAGNWSLENEVIPNLMKYDSVGAVIHKNSFWDVGSVDGYERFLIDVDPVLMAEETNEE